MIWRSFSILLLTLLFATLLPTLLEAKDRKNGERSPGDLEERIRELEDRIKKLESERATGVDKKELKKEIEKEVERNFSKGVLTFKNARIELGGKLELNFVDTQNESDPVLGSTDNPDPHFDFDRLRVAPSIDIGKNVRIEAQIDFLPDDGDTLLKEAYFVFSFDGDEVKGWEDVWWLRSRAQIGLDDRFIHLGADDRVSETYPLIGTAFWRDEEVAFIWNLRFGNKRGAPRKKQKKPKKENDLSPQRGEKTSSTEWDALDFENNFGALNVYFSIGNGYTLDSRSIIKDGAGLQKTIHDDRDVGDSGSLREIGVGLGYERDFNWLGELGALVYYFDDTLSSESEDFLLDELAVAGYDSRKNHVSRLGMRVSYHLEGYHLLDRWMDTWPGDGLYLRFEYIDADDGDLGRHGWYTQASYRFSFYRPLILDDYLRYVEPVVRYGELSQSIRKVPSQPLTWDRRAWLVGTVVGVTERILIKGEYIFNSETTGGGDVDNDELIVQLLLRF